MKVYHDLLQHILDNGITKDDRTGVGTKSVFGHQMRFDLNEGFPAMTTKKLFMRGVIVELLWFLSGDTNIKYLLENKVHIWDEWPFQNYLVKNNLDKTYPKYSESWLEQKKVFCENILSDEDFCEKWGELGPVYGRQWRNFGGVDQITQLMEDLKKNPNSRRHIVSAWNPVDIPEMMVAGLPPCHCLFQFYIADNKLSCQLYQRSADVFLGVPFNIVSYSLLTMMIAQVCDLEVGDFVHTLGDSHLYLNHLEQTDLQLSRIPKALPTMKINPEIKNIFDFKLSDFELIGYDPDPSIKAPIAV